MNTEAINNTHNENNILPGASDVQAWLPLLEGKRVGIMTNHTAIAGGVHLIDLMLAHRVNVVKVFGPEHGFRGDADDGAFVHNDTDAKTGIPIISLWNERNKPTAAELSDIDILVFDIQDVGCRFFTYIHSLQWLMESATENRKPLIILDRPNPNGNYIDGPILEPEFKSHLGLNPVPVVYGMTIGEYALMLRDENWLNVSQGNIDLTIIPCKNYTHQSLYRLPVKPSPNLPDMASVYLYPSMCFFEGTACSIGRGTDTPFRIFGHPHFPSHLYQFTPRSVKGATDPKFKNEVCYGFHVAETEEEALKLTDRKIRLHWLQKAYELFPDKDHFFEGYLGREDHFDLLAGNKTLREDIVKGLSEDEIRKSWEPGIAIFSAIRKKYLLYPDFEQGS